MHKHIWIVENDGEGPKCQDDECGLIAKQWVARVTGLSPEQVQEVIEALKHIQIEVVI